MVTHGSHTLVDHLVLLSAVLRSFLIVTAEGVTLAGRRDWATALDATYQLLMLKVRNGWSLTMVCDTTGAVVHRVATHH